MTKDEIVAELEELGEKVNRRHTVDALSAQLAAARAATDEPVDVAEPGDAFVPTTVDDSRRQLPTPALRGGNWSERVRAKQAARRAQAGLLVETDGD